MRVAGAVPDHLLSRLQRAFAPRSPFWDESRYLERGYFSFWYDLSRPPSNAVETLATHLLPLLGSCAAKVVGCEWWVHSKAASRSLGNQHGHQMHFDTEEGVLYSECEVVHPIVSSVLYLSGAAVAGPTVVLDQRYNADHPAPSAHVSHPADGHLLLFPGDRLHGVCPAAPRLPPKPQRAGRQTPLCRAHKLPRRVTLMIGFWTRDMAAALPRAPYTACGPMPRASRACTWPTLISNSQPHTDEPPAPSNAAPNASPTRHPGRHPDRVAASGVATAGALPTRHRVASVSPAWEVLPEGCADDDAWAAQPLSVPDKRNNHFFVTSMDEFRFDHIDHRPSAQSQ